MLKKILYIILIICIVLCVNTNALFSEQEPVIEEVLEKCVENYAKVKDYSCILHKKEMVNGKLKEQKNIIYKFKKPLSVYLKWTEDPDKGRETIYVQGKNNNELIVHLKIIKSFSMSLNPTGHFAMKNNRHPITEAYIGHIIGLIKKNYTMSKENKEGTIKFEGEQIIDGGKVLVFKAVFPEGKGYYGHKMFIYIDKTLYLPIKTEVYGWDNEFWEMYHYSNIKVNVGLSEVDFDVNNPAYGF